MPASEVVKSNMQRAENMTESGFPGCKLVSSNSLSEKGGALR